MNKEEVILLMSSSRSSKEWYDNLFKVMEAHSGSLPDYWQEDIVHSGLLEDRIKGLPSGDDLPSEEMIRLSKVESIPILKDLSRAIQGNRGSSIAYAIVGLLAEYSLGIAEVTAPMETMFQLSRQALRMVEQLGIDPEATGKPQSH